MIPCAVIKKMNTHNTFNLCMSGDMVIFMLR